MSFDPASGSNASAALDETTVGAIDDVEFNRDPRRKLIDELATPLKPHPEETGTGQEHMKVYLRVRPFTEVEINKGENQGCINAENQKTLTVRAPKDSNTYKNHTHGCGKQTHKFSFSKIFDEKTSQKKFFDETVLDTVKDFIEGQNCLVFTYGVTNSGKTYTIQGNPKDGGILPRSLDVVFNSIGKQQWEDMSLKPKMFCDVTKLSPRQIEVESKIKEMVFKMAADDEPDVTVSSMLEGDSSKVAINSTTMSEDSLMGPPLQPPLSRQSSIDSLANKTTESMDSSQSTEKDKEAIQAMMQEAAERIREEAAVNVDNQGRIRFSVWVSFCEIYNEYIYDLLEPIPKKKNARRPTLILREDKNGVPYAKGLKEINVMSADEAYKILTIGKRNLQMACTKLNHNSSRSHCIFTIKILRVVNKENPNMARMSMLSFCDLAGSERSNKTQSTGDRMKEAGNINTSLLALGRCIKVLRHNQNARDNQHIVPFRDSKLTRLFQSFFCGKGRACMVVNVNQNASTFDETLHALKYSAVAKQVITIQEPPPKEKEREKKEKEGNRAAVRPKRFLSMALSQTPGTRDRIARETIGWATPGTLLQLAQMEDEAANVPMPDDDDDDLFEGQVAQTEEELWDLIKALREELIEEKRKQVAMEVQIREEVCQEMAQQLVEIENTFTERLLKEQYSAEEKADKRVEMYMQSVKKSRKRKRLFDEDEEDMVPSVHLHAEQVKVQNLEKEIKSLNTQLADLKSHLQKTMDERDKLRKENSTIQFQLSEQKTQVKRLREKAEEERSNETESEQSQKDVVESLAVQLKEARTEIETKSAEIKEYQDTLDDAGQTFHRKEAEIKELKKTVEDYEKRFHEQMESISEVERLSREGKVALETANERLQKKQAEKEALEQQLLEIKGVSGEQSVNIETTGKKLAEVEAALEQKTCDCKALQDNVQHKEEEVEKLCQAVEKQSQQLAENVAEILSLQESLKKQNDAEEAQAKLEAADFKSRFAGLEKQLKQSELHVKEQENIVNDLNHQIEKHDQEIREKNQSVERLEAELNNKTEAFESLQESNSSVVQSLNDKIKEMEDNYQELSEQLDEAQNLCKKQDEEVKSVRVEVETLKQCSDSTSSELEARVIELEKQNQEAQNRLSKAESKCRHLELQVEEKEKALLEDSRRSVQLEDRVTVMEHTLQQANAEVRSKAMEAEKFREELETTKLELKEHKEKLEKANGQLQTQEESLAECNQTLKTKAEALEEVQNKLSKHTDCDVKLKQLHEELDDYIVKVNEQAELLGEMEEKLSKEQKEKSNVAEKCQKMQESELQYKAQMTEMKVKVEGLESRLGQERKQQKAAAAELDDLLTTKSVHIEEINTEVGGLKAQLKVKESDLDKALLKVSEMEKDLHLSVEEVKSLKDMVNDAKMSESNLKQELEQTKSYIAELENTVSRMKEDLLVVEGREKETKQLFTQQEETVLAQKVTEQKELNEMKNKVDKLQTELEEKEKVIKEMTCKLEEAESSSLTKKEEAEKTVNEDLEELNALRFKLNEAEKAAEEAEYKSQINCRSLKRERGQVEKLLKEREEQLQLAEEKLSQLENLHEQSDTQNTLASDLQAQLVSVQNQAEELQSHVTQIKAAREEIEASLEKEKLETAKQKEIVQDLEDCLKSSKEREQKACEQVERYKAKYQGLDVELESREDTIQNLEGELEELNANLKGGIIAKEEEIEGMNELLSEQKHKNKELKNEIRSLKKKLTEMEEIVTEQSSEVESNLLEKTAQVEELKEKLAVLEELLKSKNDEMSKLQEGKASELASSKDAYCGLQDQLNVKAQEIDTLKANLDSSSKEAKDLQNELEKKSLQVSDLENEISEQTKEVNQLQTDLACKSDSLDQLQKELDEKMNALQSQMSHTSEEKEMLESKNSELLKQLEEDKLKVACFQEQLASKSDSNKELENKMEVIKTLEKELETVQTQKTEVATQLESRESSIEGYNKQITLLKDETGILHEQITKLRDSESAARDTVAALTQELVVKEQRINELEDESEKISSQKHVALINDLQKASDRESELRQRLKDSSQRQEEQNIKFNNLEVKLQTAQEEAKEHETELKNMKQKLQSAQEDLSAAKCKFDEAEDDRARSVGRLERLRSSLEVKVQTLEEEVSRKDTRLKERTKVMTDMKTSFETERATFELALQDARSNERSIEEMKAALEEQEATMSTQDEILRRKEEEILQLQKELEDACDRYEKLASSDSSSSNRLREAEAQRRNIVSQKKEVEQELAGMKQQVARIEQDKAQAEQNVQETNKELTQLEKLLSDTRRENDILKGKQAELTAANSKMCAEQELNHDKDSNMALLRQKFQSLENCNRELEHKVEKLELEKKTVQAKKEELKVVEEQNQHLQRQVKNLEASVKSVESEKNEMKQWREARDKLVSGLEQIMKKKDAEIVSLKQQISNSGNQSQADLVKALQEKDSIIADRDAVIAELSTHLDKGNSTRGRRGRGRSGHPSGDDDKELTKDLADAKKQIILSVKAQPRRKTVGDCVTCSGSVTERQQALTCAQCHCMQHRTCGIKTHGITQERFYIMKKALGQVQLEGCQNCGQLETERVRHKSELGKVMRAKDEIIEDLRQTNIQLQQQIPGTVVMSNAVIKTEPQEIPETPATPYEESGRRSARKPTKGRPRKRKSSENEDVEAKEKKTRKARGTRSKSTRTCSTSLQVSMVDENALEIMPIQEEDVVDLSMSTPAKCRLALADTLNVSGITTVGETPPPKQERAPTFLSPERSGMSIKKEPPTTSKKKHKLRRTVEPPLMECHLQEVETPAKKDAHAIVSRQLRSRRR